MRRRGTLALAAAAACFVLFTLNVALGAFRAGAYLGDLHEMLVLLAAVVFFVIGILAREAEEAHKGPGGQP